MFDKISKKLFAIVFLLMLMIPLVTINLVNEKVAISENRRLAAQPVLFNEDGSKNDNFISDFETWMNDNIGFRSSMVVNNARIQYYLFNVLANNSDMYLGPHGELNYATEAMIKDYQHNNLYDDDYLQNYAQGMQVISDYVESKGGKLYYFQCWDKHSIYPEHFPKSVVQHGGYSKTDGAIAELIKCTDVNIVSPKEELLNAKNEYHTYSVWGDATHWTCRGAYIGYLKLMGEINEDADVEYRVLKEDDYNITWEDVGVELFGGIHLEDYEEVFEIKNPQAVLVNENLSLYADDVRHSYRINESVINNKKLLIVGDSYFNNFLVDDLAESFHETVLIWGTYLEDIKNIIDVYDPDIVIIENAERVDRSSGIIKGAETIISAE